MHSFKVPIFVYYVKTTLPILHKEKKFNPCTNRIMQLGNTITNMYVYFNYKLLSKLIENLSLLIFIFIVELKVHILLWTSMEVLWLWFCQDSIKKTYLVVDLMPSFLLGRPSLEAYYQKNKEACNSMLVFINAQRASR